MLTREEIALARALRWLKERTGTRLQRVATVARALAKRVDAQDRPCLQRLGRW